MKLFIDGNPIEHFTDNYLQGTGIDAELRVITTEYHPDDKRTKPPFISIHHGYNSEPIEIQDPNAVTTLVHELTRAIGALANLKSIHEYNTAQRENNAAE